MKKIQQAVGQFPCWHNLPENEAKEIIEVK